MDVRLSARASQLVGQSLGLVSKLALIACVGTACSRAGVNEAGLASNNSSSAVQLLSSFAKKSATFSVTDQNGQAIPNAKIMIGPRENVPFPGNVLRANDKGILSAPNEWTDAQPVTIEAAGFVRATYFGATPDHATFVLRRAVNFGKVELKGQTTGFGQLRTDGYLDLGLVIPALNRIEIATLGVPHLISPESDRMTIVGQDLKVPSNITFPDQTENYVLPLRLNKPQYRNYVAQTGAYKFVALHGRLPFRQTVDDLRAGKSFFDIINTIDFRQGSATDVTLSQASTILNLPVNGGTLGKTLPFTAPSYAQGNIVLAAAISQEGTFFYPTDLKNVAPGASIQLAVPSSQAPKMILASLRAKNLPTTGAASEFTSSAFLPSNSSQAVEFLPAVAAPSLSNQVLNLDQPTAPASLVPVLTFATLNKVELVSTGDVKVERKTPQWDVYSPLWTEQMELPLFPSTEPGTSERMRWEVAYGAVANESAAKNLVKEIGPQAVERVTHLTRSALDL